MEEKTTLAQRRASRAWEARNRKKTTIDSYRRSARTFIRNHAEHKDLDELETFIQERRKELE